MSTANWATRGTNSSAKLLQGLGILGGMANYISKPGRDLAEMVKQTGLGLGVKRVEAPKFSNQQLATMGGSKNFMKNPEVQRFQNQLGQSRASYSKLRKEVENPTFISPEEQGTTKLSEIAIGEGSGGKSKLYDYSTAIKDAAIVASMLPAAAPTSFMGAVGMGAFQGGLGGLGATKGSLGTMEGQGEALGNVGGGALVGGAISGGLYAGSKAFQGIKNSLQNRGAKNLEVSQAADDAYSSLNKQQKNGIAKQVRNSGLWEKGKTTDWNVKRFLEFRELTGLKNGSPQQVIDAMGESLDNFYAAKGQVLQSLNTTPDDILSIKELAKNNLKNQPRGSALISDENFQILMNDLDNLPSQVPGDTNLTMVLDDYRGGLRNNVRYNVKAGTTTMLPSDQRVISHAVADAIAEQLGSKGVQGSVYSNANEGIHSLLTMTGSKELANASQRYAKGLRAYGLQLSGDLLPVNKVTGGIERGLGGTQEAIGNALAGTSSGALSGTLGKVGSGLSKALGGASGTIGNVLQGAGRVPMGIPGAASANLLGGAEQETQSSEPTDSGLYIDPQTGYLQMKGATPIAGGAMGSQGGMSVIEAISKAASIMPNASESELMAFAKMLMEEGGGEGVDTSNLGVAQAKYYTVADSADEAIQLVTQLSSIPGQAQPGLGRGLASFVGEKTNLGDPGIQALRAKLSGIDLQVSNLIAGTNISKSESRRLKKLVPTMDDDLQDMIIKLNELKSIGIKGAGIGGSNSIADEYNYMNY